MRFRIQIYVEVLPDGVSRRRGLFRVDAKAVIKPPYVRHRNLSALVLVVSSAWISHQYYKENYF